MFFIDKVTLFDFLFFAFLPFSFALVRYSQLLFFFPYKSMSEYIFYSESHSFALYYLLVVKVTKDKGLTFASPLSSYLAHLLEKILGFALLLLQPVHVYAYW